MMSLQVALRYTWLTCCGSLVCSDGCNYHCFGVIQFCLGSAVSLNINLWECLDLSAPCAAMVCM